MEEKTINTKGLERYPLMFGTVLLVIGIFLAFDIIGLRAAGSFRPPMIFGLTAPGLAMIALALVPLLVGLSLRRRGAGLKLAATGFHDPRMSRNEIPWTGLMAVNAGTSNNKREQAIRLKLTPEAYKAAQVNWLAKLVVADPENGIGYTAKMVEGSLEDFGNEIHAYASQALPHTR